MNLFVTGLYRSGTTLLEKLLHAHPQAAVASQPFPYLYLGVKRAFLEARAIDARYPLGTLFRERRYRADDLTAFLAGHVLSAERIRALAADMRGYSGHWTPELTDVVERLQPGALGAVQERLHRLLAARFGKPAAEVAGSKEILCEEYLPYLLARGTAAVLILRDPRAVLTSLNFGRGPDYGGQPRPTLFHVRNWRKSVAFALAWRSAGLHVVRYEDLTAEPAVCLAALYRALGLDPDAADPPGGPIRDQRGRLWEGNSSFAATPGGTARDDQRFLQALDAATLRYVETSAYPELLALGYPLFAVDGFDPAALESFAEPVRIDRVELPADYSTRAAHIAEECERVDLLRGGPIAPDVAREWFLFEEAASVLRAAVGRG